MARILITGGSGMVGSYVNSVFSDSDCILTDVDSLDIRDHSEVMNSVKKIKPDIILHLAAATDVDKCELDSDWAIKINVTGTGNIVSACKKYGIALVFLSSGAVFDGLKLQPYVENDLTNPLNVYGKTKLSGEGIIKSGLENYLIIRAGWMIGGGKKDVKFVGKIVEKMFKSDSINVVNDKFGSLTYAKNLLFSIKNLLNGNKTGIYHMVNQGMVSRYDIALEIKNILSLKRVNINPVSSGSFPLPAPRGRSEALDNLRLRQLKLDYMCGWKEALRDYLLNDYRF